MIRFAYAAVMMTMSVMPVAHAETTVPVAAKFTVDSPIEALAADPAAKVALEGVFPGLTTHPMYDQFKSMSLPQLQPMARDKVTDDAIAKLRGALADIK